MRFRFERRYNLLKIKDDFAHLEQIRKNGDLEFVFFYNVSPHDAIAHEALLVNVTVFSRTIKARNLFGNSNVGLIDSRKLIENILTAMPNAKSAVKQQEEFSVAFCRSDISAKINNEIIGQLRAKVPAKDIKQMYHSKLKLVLASAVKDQAESKPVLQYVAHKFASEEEKDAAIETNAKRIMQEMIMRKGMDPSHIMTMTHRSVPAIDALGGILRPTRAQEVENSLESQLLNSRLFATTSDHDTYVREQIKKQHRIDNIRYSTNTDQIENNNLVQVLVQEPKTDVEIPVDITIPGYAFQLENENNSHFFVKFELINGRTGVAIDTVIKQLNTARHVQLFNTPRRPPYVKISRAEYSTRANLEIKQIDPGATAVKIYKKTFHHVVTDIDDYTLIGIFNVKRNEQSLLVQVDLPKNSPILYRVISVGDQNIPGFDYTNVVVKPLRYSPVKSLSLTAQPIDTGIKLEIRQIPQRVTAVEFKVRNATIHEVDYRNVGGDITLIDDAIRTSDYVSIVDRNVYPNNIYEYIVRMIYDRGTEKTSSNTSIEFNQPSPGKVDTKIENVVVDYGAELNVSFKIVTSIVDNNLDVIKALLQRQDIYDLFKDDVTREREFLKSLIAHNVQRVDLNTGIREDFGIITVDTFSDSIFRKNQSILPLKLGHRYRYEISALLRSPETMFETLSKDKIDVVTKKTYTFRPAKFLHPVTLNRGVIVTPAGLKTRYSKEAMSHGNIGAIEAIEVSFDDEPTSVINATASQFDKTLNVVTWNVRGSIDSIDHFIIMKDVNRVRTMIGKAHSEFQFGNCQYLHHVSRRDEGTFIYVIVPVFNNYKTGAEVMTNSVVVESTFMSRIPKRQ